MAEAVPRAIGVSKSLQGNDTRSLLDTVDSLRSQGISRYIDLPEIIVCGEQSSGKSSVLEAISGVKFPSKDNLCTRFATELILRRGPVAPVKIGIVPDAQLERSDADMQKLLNFKISAAMEDLQLADIIEAAKEAMGINDTTSAFSTDTLRLEVSGPEQAHLTLVDLPGLFQAGSRAQSDADSETVKALVLRYMKSPRSIILAVLSAKSEFNNQSITRYSREIDPMGKRTLGLITKPDKLDKGSEMEKFYLELAQNKDVKFRLGWHVLRNRDYASRDSTSEERDQVEADFFASGIWKSLPSTQVGVHSLRPRLSKILKDQIMVQLPVVLAQINEGVVECNQELAALGAPRGNLQDQKRHLLNISMSFSSLVKAAADGPYFDPFFGSAATAKGYQKRLRAVLQNHLTEFAEDMRKKGHKYDIVDELEGTVRDNHILRKDYISKVKILLKRSRGRELPGTFDPLIIGELFREQCEPWKMLVDQAVDAMLHAVLSVVDAALAHYADNNTLHGLLKHFIRPRFKVLKTELRAKVSELLEPHDAGHPITYNHYLTESVQKAQNERRAREIKKTFERALGGDFATNEVVTVNLNVTNLISSLVTKTEPDMHSYASATATDFMEAYYKVALKRFIDDFSVLAIEACLVAKLPTLFSPTDVLEMSEAVVAALASEDEETSARRTQCNEKLTVLENGLQALQSVRGYPLDHADSDVTAADSDIISTDADVNQNGKLNDTLVSPSSISPSPTPESPIPPESDEHPPEPPSEDALPEVDEQIPVAVDRFSAEYALWASALSSTEGKKKKKKRVVPPPEPEPPVWKEPVNPFLFKPA
ncbi:hypothetical protein NX059_012085 [Plenodomus lindquistii]|nr:hypothetical protein NX059_012085 [Plenodomus lindquistii]